jgi:predicted nuclease of restriction endonuclease-like (RecB) superfamily
VVHPQGHRARLEPRRYRIAIESRLYQRQGKAVTNFTRTLPPPQSDLAGEVLKNPYAFDFLTLADDARERELQS